MAVVEFLYDDIKKLIDLPKEKIINGLTEIGAPTEEGEDGMLVVEVTPNRPDFFFMTDREEGTKLIFFKEIKRLEDFKKRGEGDEKN